MVSLTLKFHQFLSGSYKYLPIINRPVTQRYMSWMGKKNVEDSERVDGEPPKKQPDVNEDSTESTDDPAIKELFSKLKSVETNLDEYKDKYQRSLADRENLRRRLEKQITDAKNYGIQSFCKDLLEVSDVFCKAIDSIPQDKVDKGDPALKDLYNGVIMTNSQLLNVFQRHGLIQIVPNKGEKFDPSFQEAMFEVPKEEETVDSGTIATVMRTGWKLKERCIRTAQVSVFK